MSWTRGRTVGRGSFAAVSVATAAPSEAFAVKSAVVSRSETLRREQALLSAMDCPHVVAYRGWDVTCRAEEEGGEPVYNLFMEYAPRGTLADAARRWGGRLEEPAVRACARDVLRGLEYVHGEGIAHCDIKGQNILVTAEGAKIADFGLARRVGDDSSSAAPGPFGGTPLFMAPEVARGERPGFAADVWSLGCTVIEIATGRPPWTDVADPISAIHRIGLSGETPEIPGFLSEQCKDFLSKCLRIDPSERWSASELLGHAFLEDEAPDFLSEETELKIPNTKSPTSVLEQVIWSSTEDTEPCHPLLQGSSLKRPPTERIQQLISEWSANSTYPAQMLNWESDESWVTVRSSESSEVAPETSRRANANEEEEEQEEVVVVSWEREEDDNDDSTRCGCNVRKFADLSPCIPSHLHLSIWAFLRAFFLPRGHLIFMVIHKNVHSLGAKFKKKKDHFNKFNTIFQIYPINAGRTIRITKAVPISIPFIIKRSGLLTERSYYGKKIRTISNT